MCNPNRNVLDLTGGCTFIGSKSVPRGSNKGALEDSTIYYSILIDQFHGKACYMGAYIAQESPGSTGAFSLEFTSDEVLHPCDSEFLIDL